MKRISLHRFNDGLTIVVIALCLYVILAPMLPSLSFWWKQSVVQTKPPLVAALEDAKTPEVIPDKNMLVIPSMRLEQEIFESGDQSALKEGIWRYPHASVPDEGLNTVLVGHRFTYGGPAVFYHLDKVKRGDQVVVYWQKQKYEYRVEEVKEVPPTAVEIQHKDTGRDMLTIYTCTPLVTAKNRLVIQAIPISTEGGAHEAS